MTVEAIGLMVLLVTAGGFALLGLIHASQQTINLEEYLISRNRFGSGLAFATILASAMGVWILFSVPEVGATSGIAGIVGYGLAQAAPAAIISLIGPRIRQLMPHGHSLNEYVLHRFGNAMYGLTLAIIVFYMFIYLTAELTGIAKAVQIMADVPLGWTALVVITATFLYTTYGGLGATVFTDAVQLVVIVPLLAICAAVAIVSLNGFGAALQPIQVNTPELLSFGYLPGIKFGATLIIAIIAAEMFNQTNWQRIYACRSNATVTRAFFGAAIATVPMLCIAGGLGLIASQFGFTDDRAFFSLMERLEPPVWFLMGVLVLALALVMSTMSSLLNGVASLFTGDLMRLMPHLQTSGLLRASRVITVAIGLPAIGIAAQGFNVLYLFLLADLVCAGAVFPVIYGLYARRLNGTIALWSSVIGIAAGALFFPKPDFTPWTGLPFAGDLLVSFIVPILVSGAIVLIWTAIGSRRNAELFDFSILQTKIQPYRDRVEAVPELTD
ncbi:sodium:solute symporter family transporter [Leptolyngbya ohadii]|uniref:sodium:solute symporter family transporter n=1 Tax=Leptolyngbya ohadii TaxID=1962290 RepID=UPI000B59D934|nr:Na+/proline symporter [Leptolyngbya ohadii]